MMTEKRAAPTAYPLAWPPGWPRTELRETGQFRTGLATALAALKDEVRRLGGSGLVLSSNVTLGSEKPADPGVVAYFTRGKQQVAIPCDRWKLVEHNVKAIANTIEAMRSIERWGAKHMITAMFQGFAALPAPGPNWRGILGFPESGPIEAEMIRQRRRELAQQHHADVGGTGSRMAEINAAADAALAESRDA